MRADARRGRFAVIAVPYAWLLVFFLLPFLVVARISVSEMDATTIRDIVTWKDGAIAVHAKLANYVLLVQDDLYLRTYVSSLVYAAVTTLLCLVIGYPFAYFMARTRASLQPALLMLVMLPFWTSFLLRVYAWKALLTERGLGADAIEAIGLDRALAALGLVPGPGQLMNTPFSLVLGMTYTYLPFMILPLYSNLAKMDLRLLEAAADLGASAWTAFWKVTVPLSRAGIIAGAMLVFIPCVGEYVIPELLGGSNTVMIGREIFNVFFQNRDWPTASALAIAVLVVLVVPITFYQYYQNKEAEGGK